MLTTVVGNYPKIANRRESDAPKAASAAFNPNATSITTATATATDNATLPTNLRRAIALFDEGKLTADQLKEVQDNVTIEVMKEQEAAGVDIITDGHIRWADDQTYIASKIKGFTMSGLLRYFDSNTYYRQPIADGKLSADGNILLADYQFAAAHANKPVKVSMDGPYTLARLSKNEHYKSDADFAFALAEILNAEAKALLKAGAPIVQFDEPAILQHKGDFALFVQVMDKLTAGLDQSKLALYTYFGSLDGLDHYFELPFGSFGIDLTDDYGRDSWAWLNFFPQGKTLGLGIVDARNTKLETVEELVAKINELPENIDRSAVLVSPNCGLEFLPRERAQEKLARMVEAVKSASR